jgi:pyruvate/2-oxoglutarate dehydrogenase complex dihydrolipoamide dehydrogenase (E3) component
MRMGAAEFCNLDGRSFVNCRIGAFRRQEKPGAESGPQDHAVHEEIQRQMGMSPRTFDAIIIGAGQAGPFLAGRLTDAGLEVAIIERKDVGGTCVNTGCMPTKTLVASARVAHVARRAHAFGVVAGDVRFDMKVAAQRARQVIEDARSGTEAWLETMTGLTFIRGHARLLGPTTVAVEGEILQAPRIFLNVGGRARVPSLPGISDVPHLDNTDVIALTSLPEHLVIVGGGYVGLEFAQMFRRFGSRVTIIEQGARLAAREDEEISSALTEMLEAEGVVVRSGAKCIALAADGAAVAVTVDCPVGEPVVRGSHVLMAVGRRPNTDDLGLANAGVEVDGRGYIAVDNQLRTNVDGIWALGECNGRGAFTHTAYNDFEIVAENLLEGGRRSLEMRVRGYAVYTDPPLGRAGMTEAEAIAKGHRTLVSTRPMSAVSRAIEKGETTGLMKLVADADTRRILGAAIFGVGGDEAIHGVLNLMSAGKPVDTLRWSVPVHPTTAELLPTLAVDLAPSGRVSE